ncbi:unnamed protein product [Lampetra planeri]
MRRSLPARPHEPPLQVPVSCESQAAPSEPEALRAPSRRGFRWTLRAKWHPRSVYATAEDPRGRSSNSLRRAAPRRQAPLRPPTSPWPVRNSVEQRSGHGASFHSGGCPDDSRAAGGLKRWATSGRLGSARIFSSRSPVVASPRRCG